MGELTILWPDADLEKLEAAKGRLEIARAGLLARSDAELMDPLADWLELWRDASSPWRERLVDRLPEAAGMSRETVAAGLELGLADWSEEALRRLVRDELGVAGQSSRARLVPFERTSVLLAGSIPMPSLLQCIVPLLLRSPTLVRAASRDRVTPMLVAESIAAVDPELGRCIEVLGFESDDRPCLESFLASDCVVASGSDETIAEVRGLLRSNQRFVGYGHRLSLAVLGPSACSSALLEQTARNLALDVALWDQLGCLSPLAVYLVSQDERGREDFVDALAAALAVQERAAPRGPIEKRVAAMIASERSEAEMRAAAGRAVSVRADESGRWTVIGEDDAGWRPAPQHRFVRVHPVADADALVQGLQPIARHLSAVALAGFDDAEHRTLAACLLGLGASRICQPGRLQAPPLDWHHDGQPVLRPLARFGDVDPRR
jgi:hypothetical protein